MKVKTVFLLLVGVFLIMPSVSAQPNTTTINLNCNDNLFGTSSCNTGVVAVGKQIQINGFVNAGCNIPTCIVILVHQIFHENILLGSNYTAISIQCFYVSCSIGTGFQSLWTPEHAGTYNVELTYVIESFSTITATQNAVIDVEAK